jgi:hypothetical protein
MAVVLKEKNAFDIISHIAELCTALNIQRRSKQEEI